MNNLTIHVVNDTTEELNILLFQQASSSTIWKNFPLQGKQDSVLSQGSVVYSSAQSIGVTRQSAQDSPSYGPPEMSMDVHAGDQLVLTINEAGKPVLSLLSTKNQDGSISCQNESSETFQIALYKSGSALLIAPTVLSHQTASFMLPSQLYVMWQDRTGNTNSQSLIPSDTTQAVTLGGYRDITATLVATDSGRSWTMQYI